MDSAYVQICYEVNQPAYFNQSQDFQIGPDLTGGTGLNGDQFPSQVQFRSEDTRTTVYETSSVDINDIEINFEQWITIRYSIYLLNVRFCTEDTVAEWLRRWTANPMCSARVGSNPIGVVLFFQKTTDQCMISQAHGWLKFSSSQQIWFLGFKYDNFKHELIDSNQMTSSLFYVLLTTEISFAYQNTKR